MDRKDFLKTIQEEFVTPRINRSVTNPNLPGISQAPKFDKTALDPNLSGPVQSFTKGKPIQPDTFRFPSPDVPDVREIIPPGTEPNSWLNRYTPDKQSPTTRIAISEMIRDRQKKKLIEKVVSSRTNTDGGNPDDKPSQSDDVVIAPVTKDKKKNKENNNASMG